jgi:hypothetical protein
VSITLTSPSHTVLTVICPSCRRAVDLECQGLTGFWGYLTYNAYTCPWCRKESHAQSTGAVVSARGHGDEVPSGRSGAGG